MHNRESESGDIRSAVHVCSYGRLRACVCMCLCMRAHMCEYVSLGRFLSGVINHTVKQKIIKVPLRVLVFTSED